MVGIQTFRIVESDPEASLNPRDIWNHWQKNVIWDPRTYYGLLECTGGIVLFLSIQEGTTGRHIGSSIVDQNLCIGVLLTIVIAPLHWFSNHRSSTNFLTRTKTHVAVLLIMASLVFLLQISSLLSTGYLRCDGSNNCQMMYFMEGLLWASVLILIFTAYLIYTLVRNPPRDPLLAELPSPPIDAEEDENSRVWTSTNIADGIQDDSLEPEGQVRL